MRFLIPALILAGCATTTGSVSRAESDLARELAGRSAGEPADCVHSTAGSSLSAVNSETIVYRTAGAVWVNRLDGACPGLRPLTTLIVEPASSGRYCRLDRFRTLEPGGGIPGPTCVLGRFTPYR